jgi:hypothetical protein
LFITAWWIPMGRRWMASHGWVLRRWWIAIRHVRRRISRIMRVHGRLIRIHRIPRHVSWWHSIGRGPFIASRRGIPFWSTTISWWIHRLIIAFRGTSTRVRISWSVRM